MASNKGALQTAASLESCDTHSMCLAFDGPPSRKRKAPHTDSSLLGLKRSCDSPFGSCDTSSYRCSQTDQLWDSPKDDIDLVASDSLEDDDFDGASTADGSLKSTTSFAELRDWDFLDVKLLDSPKSPLSLAGVANSAGVMTSSPTKSGHFLPQPLPAHCLVASTAYQYGFTPLVVSVGTTYFQRLAAVDPQLKKAAEGCPDFAPFVAHIPELGGCPAKSVGAPTHRGQSARHWLLAVHLTCIYVAAKNLEVVPYKHLLRTMLQRLHGPGITAQHAEQLEVEVLLALDWRLGPFFLHTEA